VVNPETLLITNEYVREALDQMIQVTSSNNLNPLQFLHLIDSHMLTSDFTFFQEPRKFALNDLLVSTIDIQYKRQRGLHEFAAIDIGLALLKAYEIIAEDAATGNSDLIGWSWLHFHYVEVNLRISQQQFCHLVNLDDRTIRRYQNNTINQLTKRLIRMEQETREVRRKQILYSQLPHQGTIINLFDRAKEVQLVRKSKLKHCYIIGAAGIGKTVFVEQILRAQIDNDELDHLIWIQSPKTIENVRLYLREQLLSDEAKITLIEYVSLNKTTIVIDNAENLLENVIEFQNFLYEFSNANIFLTSRSFQALPGCLQIDLGELSLQAIQSMLSRADVVTDTNLVVIDFARLIWQSVGGNPLAIELLIQNWPIFGFQAAALLTLDQIFSQLYDSMIVSERLAWLILTLLSDEVIVLANLSEIHSKYVAFADFVMLGRLCIAKTVNSENEHLTVTVSASRYIQMRYTSSLELQNSLNQFVVEIMRLDDSRINLSIIESVLSADWILTNDYRETIHQFWKAGLRQGHYTKWHIILTKYIDELIPQNLELAIGFGICQRCLGEWSQAHSVFTTIVQYAGIHSMFNFQAEALMELAVLLHYEGDYEAITKTLSHIDKLSDTYASALRNRVMVERIEVALESNNLIDAKSLFAHLPYDEPHRLILQLEIYSKDVDIGDDLPFLASLNDNLLLNFSFSASLTARMHILIGRIYQKIMDIKAATRHLTIALSVLTDIDNDPFALARTQSNLAALLITTTQFLDARKLLRSAENIQRKIGDRVGLAVTIHNQHVLNRKIVD
jgi:tetratricopeptide (TPR) repeat protein